MSDQPSDLTKRIADIVLNLTRISGGCMTGDCEHVLLDDCIYAIAEVLCLHGLAGLEARLAAAERELEKRKAEKDDVLVNAADHAKLIRERDEAERLLRLAGAHACDEPLGDHSLTFLRKGHSPELADIAVAIELAITRHRLATEKGE